MEREMLNVTQLSWSCNDLFPGINMYLLSFSKLVPSILFYFPGLIGCGYFDPCRKFKPEICEMIGNLVSAGRVLWQWTKVQKGHCL